MAKFSKYDRHLRNVLLDYELATRAYDWHRGQDSYLYSLASTAIAGELVSRAMIRAAIDELPDEAMNVAGDLLEVDRDWRSHTAAAYGLETTDNGYSEWLMDPDERREWLDSAATPAPRVREVKMAKVRAPRSAARRPSPAKPGKKSSTPSARSVKIGRVSVKIR